MGPVRLRLLFGDRHMLSKSQKKEGLKRSWIHLKPQHKTISDLAAYLTHIFDLDDACPHGLTLSMDGYVLPFFESTRVLKDKDLICVKRKQGTLGDIIKVGNGAVSSEEEDIVEKQPVTTGMKLLANEEFDKETGGYQSESEEDKEDQSKDSLHVENALNVNAVSKKRKASTKLRSSKRKKNKCTADGCPDVPEGDEDVENDVHTEKTESCIDYGVFSKRGQVQKYKPSDVKVKPYRTGIPEIGKKSDDIGDTMLKSKRLQRLDKDDKGADVGHLTDETKKLPSRSARRKKAKRRWLRESSKVEKKELNQHQLSEKDIQQSPEKDNKQSPQKDSMQSTKEKNRISPEKQDQSSDVEEEVFPVVVRPGHIRFEPLGKDSVVQQNQTPVENFQWNGITSKKKGQKWGKERATYSGWSNNNDLNQEVSEMLTTEGEASDYPIDFDKLMPYDGLPEKGDIMAYRLIELSSSWCPEISPFLAGKISQYDPETNKVTLESVPEHPVVFEKLDDEAFAPQLDTSLYNEDGSLEIEFSSLIDVRIVKHGNLEAANAVTGTVNGTHVGDKDTVQHSTPNGNSRVKKDVSPPENNVNMWDEISEVLSAKKAQLSKEEGWKKKESSRKNSWPYKGLRGSALGPTMAILRAHNEL